MEMKDRGSIGESGGDGDDGDHKRPFMCTGCGMRFRWPDYLFVHKCSSTDQPTAATPSVNQRIILSLPMSKIAIEGRPKAIVKDPPSSLGISGDQSGGRPASFHIQGDQDESHVRQDAVNRHGCSAFHSRNEFLLSTEKETYQSNLKEPESQNINVSINEEDRPASVPTTEFLPATEEKSSGKNLKLGISSARNDKRVMVVKKNDALSRGHYTAPTPRTEIPSPAEKKPCQKTLELALDDQGLIYFKEKEVFDQGQCSAPLPRNEFLLPAEHIAQPESETQGNSVAGASSSNPLLAALFNEMDVEVLEGRKFEEEMSVSLTGPSSSNASSVASNWETDDEKLEG